MISKWWIRAFIYTKIQLQYLGYLKESSFINIRNDVHNDLNWMNYELITVKEEISLGHLMTSVRLALKYMDCITAMRVVKLSPIIIDLC